MLSLFGDVVGILWMLGLLSGLLLYVWLPYMTWSMTRNVRQIRVQLERLNDTLERERPPARAGVLTL